MTSTDHTTLQSAAVRLDRKIPTVQETYQLISRFLPDFLRLAESDAAARMKLETCTIIPGAADGATDILFAQVSSCHGEGVTVIVAIEPKALPPAEVARKLGNVLLQSELTFGNPVLLTVVYISGGRPGLHLESAQLGTYRDLECVRLYFTNWGLADSNAEHYLSRPEPLAWALAPYMRSTSKCQQELTQAAHARISGARLSAELEASLIHFLPDLSAQVLRSGPRDSTMAPRTPREPTTARVSTTAAAGTLTVEAAAPPDSQTSGSPQAANFSSGLC